MFWKRFAAVLLVAICTPMFAPAFAQDTLGLTAGQLKIVDALGDEALKHSSAYIQGLRELDATQREESPLGVAVSGLNLTIGGGVGASDPFEQANTRASVTVSVNLAEIVKKANTPSQTPALQAKAGEIERGVRLECLRRYSAWRLAVDKARNAANSLDVRLAEKATVEARIKAGTATNVDLLRVLDSLDNAQSSLLEANHNVVVSKMELARAVGVSHERLNAILAGK
jgi:Outer membrane efflux protein